VRREILRQYLTRRLLKTEDDDDDDDDNNDDGRQGEEEGEAGKEGEVGKEGEDNECKGLFFSSDVTDDDFFHRPGKG